MSSDSKSQSAVSAGLSLARIRSAYSRAVDACLPEALLAAGGEELRCARIVVGFSLTLALLGFEAIGFFHWALPAGGAVPIEIATLIGLSLVALIPWALRRFGSTELAANMVVAAAFLVLSTIFVVLGGIRSPVLHWCALFPMLSVLMGARRSAWGWGAVAASTVVVFAGIEVGGVALPNYLFESGLIGERLWIQRSIDVGSWIVILFVVGLVYDRHKEQYTSELGSANAELVREIAQRRRAEQRTRYLAYYDQLTSLPNRQFFKEQLELAMCNAERDDRTVGVMFLDLDSFKEVNDTWGHRVGDLLLQQVSERLQTCVRNADSIFRGSSTDPDEEDAVVSRLGGDEFTVLLVKLRSPGEAAIVARRILNSFEAPFSIEDHEIHTSASIGIALYPRDVQDVNELLKHADLAMYHAKERGKSNFQFFNESMNAEVLHRATLTTELRRARERGEFVVHFQPIVQAATGGIVAVEALLRWEHPTRGLLYPGEFMAIAEESGLISPIAEDVLIRACQENRRWQDEGLPPVRIAVNISGAQLRQRRLRDSVAQALDQTDLDPKYLELEITESAMMEDEVEAGRSLTQLKNLGVGLALDDFGTGYSSLSYVQRYPVDSLKIDRSFVSEIVTHPDAQAITTAIIAMAHGLNLRVVAEGVETEQQERILLDLGCDELQGYYFSKALPADEILELLRSGLRPRDQS